MSARQQWPVQEAKAKFSEMLEASVHDGPQLITKRGVHTAVLVSAEQWNFLQRRARRSLKEMLLAEEARTDTLAPERGNAKRRPILDF